VAAARGRTRKMTTTTTSGWLTGSPPILTVSSALDKILFLFPCSFTNLLYVGCNNKIKTEKFQLWCWSSSDEDATHSRSP
jgi:hypothetical protein